MEFAEKMAPAEVPMVQAEVVLQVRELRRVGWGFKRIAKELGLDRRTVRRYVAQPQLEPGHQERSRARQLDAAARMLAFDLFDGPAQQNAVVVARMLCERGIDARERVVQKLVAPRRRELRAAQLATVRFETEPGKQMQ